MMLNKSIRHESKAIRESARGQTCQVRLPSVCNFNPETTILAHVRLHTGAGRKASDLHGAYCCDACHSEVDRRTCKLNSQEVKVAFYEGVFRTQQMMLDKGLVRLA